MVNMIADYLSCGGWMHQAFQLSGTNDTELAVELVLDTLRRQNCRPACVAVVHGNHSLKELETLRAGVFEIYYYDPELSRESGKGVKC